MITSGLCDEPGALAWTAVDRIADQLGTLVDSAAVSRILVVPRTGAELVIALRTARQHAVDLIVMPPHMPAETAHALRPDSVAYIDPQAGTATLHPVAERCATAERAPGVWIFSSGTTGIPSATHWPWRTLTGDVDWSFDRDAAEAERWAVGYAPFGFAGITATCQALGRAGYVEFLKPEGLLVGSGQVHELTVTTGTPSFWRMAVILASQRSAGVRRVRTVSMGGEPVDDTLLDMVRSTFEPERIKQIFGTTEFGTVMSVEDGRGGLPARLRGRRLRSGAAFDVRDDRLVVSAAPGEPFVETGDVVRVEGDRIVCIGRGARMVNVGGYKVAPLVVSRVLEEHSLVLAAQAYGLRSPVLGQVVAADVVIDDNCRVPDDIVLELKQFSAVRLAEHERPLRIRIVKELRLAASGKVSWDG